MSRREYAPSELCRFTIELVHNDIHWTVQRRYNDFLKLHTDLLSFRATERMKAPIRA